MKIVEWKVGSAFLWLPNCLSYTFATKVGRRQENSKVSGLLWFQLENAECERAVIENEILITYFLLLSSLASTFFLSYTYVHIYNILITLSSARGVKLNKQNCCAHLLSDKRLFSYIYITFFSLFYIFYVDTRINLLFFIELIIRVYFKDWLFGF